MLNPNVIRENPDLVKRGISNRGGNPSLVDDFLKADSDWRELTGKIEELRARKNKLGKDDQEQARKIKEETKGLEVELKPLNERRETALLLIPNVPEERAPVGRDESGNVVLREVGKVPQFKFEPKDYLALAGAGIDIERAGKVSGTRFGYILGDLPLLEFALVRFVFEKLGKHGFVPIVPPVLIKPEPMIGMGKNKFIADGDAFFIEKDNLYLVGTAEDTIGSMYMGETLEEKALPLRFAGFSTAFRREAGSYGKDTKGILRVHQFDKVEMFSFTKPEDSIEENDFLLKMQEEIMQALNLPYRVVHISTGDMGFSASNQFDVETWIPSEGKYRETHSCSNTTDFQSRGLNIKYKNGKGGGYVHTLNATAVAIGRTLMAILENNQNSKGKVAIPKVLQKYVGKKEIEKPQLP
ncbi:MAG: Serine-tRNA ligase [Candidatus Nomurabacteria bacterium GW2011_GWA1_46_11]|uniref:Serine--tRNA ligase n=1 Tax=Candidatus Nomurabacteria bacterium GW2011_GWA1_46_11 TaxID=1618732 RepID=A0A0G1QWJ8_9BACT|nr:MAG: Serine-tRNA ligase [Parcubacteria group bacterium GW2011_GWA2_46_10]KKU22158.1 MAG: Serine-tRNA ligase [Candidatus Nomurabacteria bacterium GW2011_GWA1_46_11]